MKIRLRHERLAARMAESRMSQNRWAQILGLHKGHLSRLVNGKRLYPGPDTRRKLTRGLGIPFEELFEVEFKSRQPRPRTGWLASRAGILRRGLAARPAWTGPSRGGNVLQGLLEDVRYGLRLLAKRPAFTALAVVTLALGIGANTAVFSFVNAVLIRPSPYQEPDRLALLWSLKIKQGSRGSISYPDFLDWREHLTAFDSLAAFGSENLTLLGKDGAERIQAEIVTAEYFPLLGASAARGRTFSTDETSRLGSEAVAILSHGFWTRRFGGDEALLGADLRINGTAYKVIGIMPPTFHGLGGPVDAWLPLTMFDRMHPELVQYKILEYRGIRFLNAVGSLAPVSSWSSAQVEMDGLAERLRSAHPKTNSDRGIVTEPIAETLVGDTRKPLLLLMGAVGLVLLIACINLANLYLVRDSARHREMAVRNALGARRGRLVRQMLTESLLLAAIGGAAGVATAWAGLDLLVAFTPEVFPGYIHVSVDPTVLGFSLLLSLLVGLLFGSIPALIGSKLGIKDTLHRESGSLVKGLRSSWLHNSLMAAEVALCLTLLIGAGLLWKGFAKVSEFDPGIQRDQLLTLRFDLPAHKYSTEEQMFLMDSFVTKIGAMPTVDSAALASHIYFGGGYMTGDLSLEGRAPDEEPIDTYQFYVGPGYFRTTGIELRKGREFQSSDRQDTPRVAVVGRSTAERFWPGQDALGKRLTLGRIKPDTEWIEVVGVVSDVRPTLRGEKRPLQIYLPVRQGGHWSRAMVVRSSMGAGLAPTLRAVVGEVEPDVPLYRIAPMNQLLSESSSDTRFVASLMGIFAILALILAMVGVYGVISFTTSRARAEFGIRMAMGASPRNVISQVLRYGGVRTLAGLGIGLLASVALTRLLESVLFEVDPLDPQVFAAVTALLGAIAILACYLPARRASRLDPMETIRSD